MRRRRSSCLASAGGCSILCVLLLFQGTTVSCSRGRSSATASLPLTTPATAKGLATRVTGYGSRKRYEEPTNSNSSWVGHGRRVRLRIIDDKELLVTDTHHNQTVRIRSYDGHFDWANATEFDIEGNATGFARELLVDGLFGVYSLPSARLWVWIAESDQVYAAPSIDKERWWSIRKVKRLEIVRLPYHDNGKSSRLERQEELRQVALLRQALKQHDWYYSASPLNSLSVDMPPVVPDMVHNLQTSIARYMETTSATTANGTVTNSTSAAELTGIMSSSQANESTIDSRFFWNEALMEAIAVEASDREHDNSDTVQFLQKLVVPVTSAFVGIQTDLDIVSEDSDSTGLCYDLLLITRRSRFRVGTRFTRRGADATGNCANYAETEQVLLLKHKANATLAAICSHLQTRGSIPIRWSSPTDIKTYRPRVRIGIDPMAQAKALRAHLVDQLSRYVVAPTYNQTESTTIKCEQPLLLLVNLIDKKSDQGRLGRAFDSVLKAVLDVYSSSPGLLSSFTNSGHGLQALLNGYCIQHIWFDFHAELKHGRWDKLGNLLNLVKQPLLAQGYFRAIPRRLNDTVSFSIDRVQTGITRTNCMDCLDRTNVVQSVFGRYMAFTQLADYKPLGLPLSFKTAFRRNALSLPWTNGEVAHRLVWADNADAISSLYAGTPALKGDFTRTGRRTKMGALDDGMNSLQRFYLNNFFDAFRQEGMDLLIGLRPFSASTDTREPAAAQSNLVYNGMSIQEAARRAFLGNWNGDNGDDDGGHARIKVPKGEMGLLPAGGSIAHKQRLLDLRWLPGDLQNQVRDAASPISLFCGNSNLLLADEALERMDVRASSHLPWWYAAESSSSEPESVRGVRIADTDGTNNAGYLLVGLVAGTQAPIGIAGTVLAMMTIAACGTSSEARLKLL